MRAGLLSPFLFGLFHRRAWSYAKETLSRHCTPRMDCRNLRELYGARRNQDEPTVQRKFTSFWIDRSVDDLHATSNSDVVPFHPMSLCLLNANRSSEVVKTVHLLSTKRFKNSRGKKRVAIEYLRPGWWHSRCWLACRWQYIDEIWSILNTVTSYHLEGFC